MPAPAADIVRETRRLLDAAVTNKVTLRLLGGLAVKLHSGPESHPAFERDFNDIDFATRLKESRDAEAFFIAMGYEADPAFNAINAGRRGIFHDPDDRWHIDVFIDSFEMCHNIPITERIDVEPETIPLAELLLTKLQIVQINEKDQRDIAALLYEHEVGDDDRETINAGQIARLCAADWGLWRTCRLNVEKMRGAIDRYEVAPDEREVVIRRLDELWERIQDEPKSRRWKLRDRVGDRRPWYLEPQEVEAEGY